MTPERFRQCLAALGWTNRWLGDYLHGLNRHAVDRWASGAQPIPANVAEWLETRVRLAKLHEFPRGWDR